MEKKNQFEDSNNFDQMSGGEVQTLNFEEVKSMLHTLTPEEIEDMFSTLQTIREEKKRVKKAKFLVEGRNLICKKVKEVRDKIEDQTKIHAQKKERAQEINEERNNVLEKFEASLQEIQKQYQERFEEILKQRSILENQEQGTLISEYKIKQERKELKKTPKCVELLKQEKELKKQIKVALAKGDLELVEQKNNELKDLKKENPLIPLEQEIKAVQNRRHRIKQLLKECDQEILNCEIDRIDRIDEATELKDNKLKTLKKKNIFQKIAGILLNKRDKGNQYQGNVIKDVEERVEYINKKSIPQVIQSTEAEVKAFEQKMAEKRKRNIR